MSTQNLLSVRPYTIEDREVAIKLIREDYEADGRRWDKAKETEVVADCLGLRNRNFLNPYFADRTENFFFLAFAKMPKHSSGSREYPQEAAGGLFVGFIPPFPEAFAADRFIPLEVGVTIGIPIIAKGYIQKAEIQRALIDEIVTLSRQAGYKEVWARSLETAGEDQAGLARALLESRFTPREIGQDVPGYWLPLAA